MKKERKKRKTVQNTTLCASSFYSMQSNLEFWTTFDNNLCEFTQTNSKGYFEVKKQFKRSFFNLLTYKNEPDLDFVRQIQ